MEEQAVVTQQEQPPGPAPAEKWRQGVTLSALEAAEASRALMEALLLPQTGYRVARLAGAKAELDRAARRLDELMVEG